jgi:MFS family permease
MTNPEPNVDKSFKRRLFLPLLILSFFAINTFAVVVNTLLVNIAGSFNVSVGAASQLLSVGLFAGLIIGIAMSFLVIKYKHKSLYVLGFAFFTGGILGSFFAPNFASILIFQAIMAIGGAMVGILVFTLIGDVLPLKQKGGAIGLTKAALFAASILVPQISSGIANIGSWRSVLLWFIFPVSLACLVLSLLVFPSKPNTQGLTIKPQYREALKQIFLNRSAIACMAGSALLAIIALVPAYAVSFYRIAFHEPLSTAALFSSIAAVGGVVGAAAAGRMVNRFGRKPLTLVTAFVCGVLAAVFSFVPNVWISVALWALCTASVGMSDTALTGLSLEQVPGFRGSMMSVQGMFRNIGLILGIVISGILLDIYLNNFYLLMVIYGICGIAAAPILLLAKDSCKTEPIQ